MIFRKLCIVFLLSLLLSPGVFNHHASASEIHVLTVKGAIGPAFADYFIRSLAAANEKNATAVILQMDTPGGLDKAMRQMIQAISSSTVPVITYVTPTGARAASAGTYLLYASHVAAMAPGTNLGAATPVSIGGGMTPKSPTPASENPNNAPPKQEKTSMEKKVINDAIAYIKGLADLHGRNKEWAIKAVEDAESLPAKEALSLNVIDFIATDINDLLTQVNGAAIQLQGKETTLNLNDMELLFIDPDWKTKFLSIVTSPDIAYLLLIAGAYCIFLEFSNPGSIIPGVLGSLSLIFSFYGLNMLPVNYIGLLLIVFGIACIIGEAFVASFGALGILGSIIFFLGSSMLIDTGLEAFQVSFPIILSLTITNIIIFVFVFQYIIKSFKKNVITGKQELLEAEGIALESFDTKGFIRVRGERWQAISSTPIKKGDSVLIEKINGLLLTIKQKETNQ